MTDRTTKALLAAIALGLWLNVLGDWMRPTPVSAAEEQSRDIRDIANDVGAIATGLCLNQKIC